LSIETIKNKFNHYIMVSSTLVNVSDEAEARLITLLFESSNNNDSSSGESLQQQCATYLSEGNLYELLTTLISSTSMNIMLLEPVTEVATIVSLLSNMIQRLDSPDKIKEVLTSLIEKVAQAVPNTATELPGSTTMIERNMTILSVLYNMMDKSYKCMLLERMIQLMGSKNDGSDLDDLALVFLQPDTALGRLLSSPIVSSASSSNNNITSPQPPIVNMLQSWNVTDTERRSIYTTVCNALPSNDLRQQRFLLLLIETYSSDGSINEGTIVNDNDVVNIVKQVSINTIRDPVTLFRDQRNLLSRNIVQQILLKHDPALLALLTVFQEGTMLEYEQFIATHASSKDDGAITTLFSQWGLDHQQCVRYMRILSLCTLAIGQEVITYDEIRKSLHLNENDDEDVESWVIAAVNSGLLQAKMDQLQEMVMIERCVVRKFDLTQWRNVQSKLVSYKEQVGTVLNALKEQQSIKKQ
jgi:translation initiation factor 3 subunit M